MIQPTSMFLRPARCLCLCLCLGLLAGCVTLGPDYQEPDVTWLQDWQTDLYGQVGTAPSGQDADLSFWWQVFDDPVLSGLVMEARRNSPTMELAGLAVLESRAAAGIADAARYPQVQQITGSATSITAGESGSGESDSFADYGLAFGIGWEMDFWGRFRRSIESADAAFFANSRPSAVPQDAAFGEAV